MGTYTNMNYGFYSRSDTFLQAPIPEKITDEWEIEAVRKYHEEKPNNGSFDNRVWYLTNGQACLGSWRKPSNKIFYIPVEWLNLFGYSEDDLKKWIGICTFPRTFNLPIKYLGKKTMTKEMRQYMTTKYHSGSYAPFSKDVDPTDAKKMEIKGNEWYIVSIEGKDKSTFKNYLSVILVRYIYNHLYHDIPRTVFELHEALDNVNYWQCLLIAHFKRRYYFYYSIIDQEVNPNNNMVHELHNLMLSPFKPLDVEKLDAYYAAQYVVSGSKAMNTTMHDVFHDPRLNKLGDGTIKELFVNKQYKEIYDRLKEAVKD